MNPIFANPDKSKMKSKKRTQVAYLKQDPIEDDSLA